MEDIKLPHTSASDPAGSVALPGVPPSALVDRALIALVRLLARQAAAEWLAAAVAEQRDEAAAAAGLEAAP